MKIEQDIHIHTHRSLCANPTATVAHYVAKAKELGLSTIGFSDHMWDHAVTGYEDYTDTFYHIQDYEYVCELKKEIEAVPHDGLRILFGAESEYSTATRTPAIALETAKQLDFLLVPNSHTHLVMPKELAAPARMKEHMEFMLQAFYDIIRSDVAPYITAIAHPFAVCCYDYDCRDLIPYLTEEQYADCFAEAAKRGIAMEINTCSFCKTINWVRHVETVEQLEKDPYLQLFRIAKAAGCKFTFGSDAHGSSYHDENFLSAYTIAALLDLGKDDIRLI